jgi:hypothetical protein
VSFPPDVAEQALLDSGRHCCLCHRFCGFKIELHHIVQRAERGEDTYDNCIPLCFDCHAEVKAYNPKHPKGRQYTVSELKGHRDRWYQKVKAGHGINVSPDYLQLDRNLFQQIREILPSTGSIAFVRVQDYGGPFPWHQHDDLRQFGEFSRLPECEFMDPDLEGMRARLTESIEQFLKRIGEYAFPLDTNLEFSRLDRVPYEDPQAMAYYRQTAQNEEELRELVQMNTDRVLKQYREVNELANLVYKAYDEFIRFARRKLAI